MAKLTDVELTSGQWLTITQNVETESAVEERTLTKINEAIDGTDDEWMISIGFTLPQMEVVDLWMEALEEAELEEAEEEMEAEVASQAKGWTPEKRAMMAEKMKGRTHSDEVKQTLREKALARWEVGRDSGTFCRRCGQLLTTAESILAGIGPECAQKEEDGEA